MSFSEVTNDKYVTEQLTLFRSRIGRLELLLDPKTDPTQKDQLQKLLKKTDEALETISKNQSRIDTLAKEIFPNQPEEEEDQKDEQKGKKKRCTAKTIFKCGSILVFSAGTCFMSYKMTKNKYPQLYEKLMKIVEKKKN
ncbi:polyketide cyclase/dehydrase and lipid transport superfamily protein [Anaeramoeba flamelloides]|uniref:Polyketide cyclase/dehydrase and lipid transport superfamily protein n=1 Tax=Anaeramoeba flamelloides TaxID=1746091 RepID=A0AAV7YME6_9EUKA|nr:polyketide cyclase/dehydrase and lipid transport superfamily protein [Anaeramoeba flamelloides]KAJ6247426.1 polyketide cyclase/dehydrase and lipid transport superfamily protein [Anaeramoeba flamelloides]